ncbi:MAG: hypothetical protein EBX50_17960 [Chitinophagia bacterium]|nr:hypothetical protein [Chitinophagia bacterium]
MSQTYYVVEKLINEQWEDWVVLSESHSLDEAIEAFVASEKTENSSFRLVKRTDKVINKNIYGKVD